MHIIEDEYAPPNCDLFLHSTVSNELEYLRICIYSKHATSSCQLKKFGYTFIIHYVDNETILQLFRDIELLGSTIPKLFVKLF